MSIVLELDPVAIRQSLQTDREKGLPFQEAWKNATGSIAGDDKATVAFMFKHFRAAYYNTDEAAGRCMVPERDVSRALTVIREVSTHINHERCRSGDGCDHQATHGRHGKTWCEYHFLELERIRMQYEVATTKAARANSIPGAGMKPEPELRAA